VLLRWPDVAFGGNLPELGRPLLLGGQSALVLGRKTGRRTDALNANLVALWPNWAAATEGRFGEAPIIVRYLRTSQ
jgi:hypothetical protein